MSNETALQIIETASKNGSLICFDKNNGFPQVDLYRAEITSITIDKKNDCYNISKKYMPKKEVVDRIGEAAGVTFIKGETRTQTIDDATCGKHVVYTGIAQGEMRMSDGTKRRSSICEYEFDPTLRAMLDFDVTELNAETKKKKKIWDDHGTKKEYGDPLAVAILEYQKTGRQRANTGARLRVIRELVGMPIAFTEEQVAKPVVFGRIVQNTSYILGTPEGRIMATAQALGADVSSLFGRPQITSMDQPETINVTPPSNGENPPDDTPPVNSAGASAAAEAARNDEPDFPDEPTGPSNQQEDVFKEKGIQIEQLMATYKDTLNVVSKNGKNPYKMAEEELANPNSTVESRDSMIDRLRKWLEAKGIKV
jgi:hypothetical protein